MLLLLSLLGSACGLPAPVGMGVNTATAPAPPGPCLRLATTTSTADSGLLEAILPDFERSCGGRVEVIAVGTGQALVLGENGDADVLLVHAREREDEFVAQGFGTGRRDVMYNDFVIVGPSTDPAGIRGKTAAHALHAIAEAEAPFLSRGDDSGTHSKEQSLWTAAGIAPSSELDWYRSLGQGMGETLIAANEQPGYTLSDRGTFLGMGARLSDLHVLVGGASIAENTDPTLRNPYGVIPVNPARHPSVAHEQAERFVQWLVSSETQQAIGSFGVERFGQPLFYPVAQTAGAR